MSYFFRTPSYIAIYKKSILCVRIQESWKYKGKVDMQTNFFKQPDMLPFYLQEKQKQEKKP